MTLGERSHFCFPPPSSGVVTGHMKVTAESRSGRGVSVCPAVKWVSKHLPRGTVVRVDAAGVFILDTALHMHLCIRRPPTPPRGAGEGTMPHPPDSWLRTHRRGQDKAPAVWSRHAPKDAQSIINKTRGVPDAA